MQKVIWRLSVVVALSLVGTSAGAQEVADPGFKSVGRGAPLAADLRKFDIVGPALRGPFGIPGVQGPAGAPGAGRGKRGQGRGHRRRARARALPPGKGFLHRG